MNPLDKPWRIGNLIFYFIMADRWFDDLVRHGIPKDRTSKKGEKNSRETIGIRNGQGWIWSIFDKFKRAVYLIKEPN